MTVEERLEKVEREQAETKAELEEQRQVVAQMRKDAAQGPAQIVPEVRARSFVLVDENGKPRAGLAVIKDGPALSLFDENGKVRTLLTALKDGPGLTLFDENEKHRVVLGVIEDGPALNLFDENGKVRTALRMSKDGNVLMGLSSSDGKSFSGMVMTKDGEVGFALTEPQGTPRIALSLDQKGTNPTIVVTDAKGTRRFLLRVTPDTDISALTLDDSKGQTRIGMVVTPEVCGLVLLDKDGKAGALAAMDEKGHVPWGAVPSGFKGLLDKVAKSKDLFSVALALAKQIIKTARKGS